MVISQGWGDIMGVRNNSDVMRDRNGHDITGMAVMSWEPVTHGTRVSMTSCEAVVMAWGM